MNLENEFPVLRELIFMNHAGVSPLPARVAQAMRAFLDEFECVGPLHYRKYKELLTRVRTTAARVIGCEPDEVAYIKNTTEGLMLVAGGLTWRPGDTIVTAAHEFPANVYPWRSLARLGVQLRVVPERDYGFAVEDFARAIDERTRLLTVSAVQFSTGFRMPLAALGRLCRERGVLFCVDAIQALGVMPLEARAWGIDFLSADGHKWLLGPEGFGLFYCRRERLEALSGNVFGWQGVANPQDYDNTEQPLIGDARRFEEGTHNLVGLVGLGAAIDLLLEVGLAEVERRLLAVTRRLIDGLQARGCELFTPLDDRRRLGIVSFRHPAEESEAVFKRLLGRNIIGAHRRGWVRLSPHFYNTEAQVDAVLEGIASL